MSDDTSEPTEVTFTSRGEQQRAAAKKQTARDGRFWRTPLSADGEPLPALHTQVFPWVESLWSAWRRLRQRDREHDLIYENRQLRVGGRYHPGVRALEMAGFDSSELFVTTGIVDTFDARFSKRKAMPMFVVDDAEWDLKRQAQEFRRWLHGKLRQVEFEKVYGECVTDALVRGDGVAYVDEGDEDVFVERVHRSELLVDPYEARQGADAVRTMYRFRAVSRDALVARFPEHAAAIMAAPEAPEREDAFASDWLASEARLGTRDVVELVEGWHLPDRECDDDEDGGGRHFICLDGATLCYKPWKDVRFPFARLTCYRPRRGYWGRGIVEKLRPIQGQINRMVADIAANVAVTGKGIWTVPEQADVPVERLTGYRPFKLTYKGIRPPEFMHPVPISPVTLSLLQQKIAWAHELTGAAQWSAQGKSPLGNGASGVAIDNMEDLLSDRHSKLEENCALFRLDVAQCLLDAAGRVVARSEAEEGEDEEREDEEREDDEPEEMEAHEEGEDEDEERAESAKAKPARKRRPYYATWLDKGRLERLDWHQVAVTREQYRLQLEPVAFMPHTRSGKLAAAAELIKTGVIRQDQAAALFDEPDLAHLNRIELAPKRNAERLMEVVGNPDKPMPSPEEWHDLTLLLDLTKKYYNRAQSEDAPDEVQIRYREFGDMVIAVQDLLKRREAEKAAALAPPAPGGAMPPGPGPAGAMPMGGPGSMDPAAGGMPPMPGAPPMAA